MQYFLKTSFIIFIICIFYFNITASTYAAPSSLIFGTNLLLNDSNDQFVTSQATRDFMQQIHVQIVRIPIRTVGGPAPEVIAAAQDIKAMGAVPLIILKFSQPDPAGAGKLVVQAMNQVFGNSVVYYEFGNERDINGVDKVMYTNTWNQVIPQLKSIAINGKFGGPTTASPNTTYIAYFVQNANPQPDFVSYHQYTCSSSDSTQTCMNNIPTYKTNFDNVKNAIAATGKTIPPIMLTEWNYDAVPPNPDPRITSQFETQYTQAMFKELANDGFFATMQYLVTGSGVYQLIDSSPALTAEGHMFGQMYTQLIGNNGGVSPQPSNTGGNTFQISVCPHGLGACGDNVNAQGGGNIQPIHQQKNITLAFYDSSNQLVTTIQGIVTYVASTKNFTGILTGNIAKGTYIVKLKLDGFLQKQIPGIITVSGTQQTAIPSVSAVNGDVNNDNQLDILDYNAIISCFGSKQHTSSCALAPTVVSSGADINDDGIVNGSDYNLLLRELSVQTGT